MHLASGAALQILPAGLEVPPVPYLVALAALAGVQAAALYALRPAVTQRLVVAFVPWMVTGGALHALHQHGAVPAVLGPLLAAPAVYVTTTVLACAVWTASTYRARIQDRPERIPRDVGAVGTVLVVGLTVFAYARALADTGPSVALAWPVVGFLGALVLFAPAYYLLAFRWTETVNRAGSAGAAAVYAHVLDGVSTAIGIDVVGTVERSPIPRRIMDFAGTLPTEPYLGRGWLFVVVKFVVAVAIVFLLADYADEEPSEGNLLLAAVTALGLGPAANNLFLFLLGT